MPIPMSKAALSPARRRLVELLQQLNFGRVEGLSVLDGDPIIDAATPVGRDVNRLFVGFLQREFGNDAFRVERVDAAPNQQTQEVHA